jgi:hypothetical protein
MIEDYSTEPVSESAAGISFRYGLRLVKQTIPVNRNSEPSFMRGSMRSKVAQVASIIINIIIINLIMITAITPTT